MKILVVEDEPTCRLALKITLTKWGYDVVVAQDGEEAWQIMQQQDSPKVVILDWLMPGMDGLQLCRKIRERSAFGYVYIIMLTAKRRQEDVITCLEAGADDYIVKPFTKEGLRNSIATGARRVIADYATVCGGSGANKDEIMENYSSQMQRLAQQQSLQRLHLDRMATVGLMSAGVAHEINNPTSYVLGSAKNLKLFWEEVEPILQKHAEKAGDDKENLEFILARIQANIDAICSGVERILSITDGLKAFSHMGSSHHAVCNVNTCVLHSLEFCRNTLKNNVSVEKNLARSLPKIMADSLQIEQVLINFFVNAADAMEQQTQGILSIETRQDNDRVVISVSDTGPGVPENDLDNIWQPFFTTKAVGKGTGLGLSTVRKIIENHSGEIEVSNKPCGGAEFSISLPAVVRNMPETSGPLPHLATQDAAAGQAKGPED